MSLYRDSRHFDDRYFFVFVNKYVLISFIQKKRPFFRMNIKDDILPVMGMNKQIHRTCSLI